MANSNTRGCSRLFSTKFIAARSANEQGLARAAAAGRVAPTATPSTDVLDAIVAADNARRRIAAAIAARHAGRVA